MARLWRDGIAALLLVLVLGSLGQAQDVPSAVLVDYSTLHAGPGHTYAAIAELPAETRVSVQRRNAVGHWLEVSSDTLTPVTGWVPAGQLRLPDGLRLSALEVADLPDADLSRVIDPLEAELYALPLLPSISANACNIYNGASLWSKRSADAVTRVGDSNSASEVYLSPIARGDYDLGAYDFLEDAAAFFGPSLDEPSEAAQVGFNAASALDPFWASSQCQPNESPLACELRRSPASLSVVMFGMNDALSLNRSDYEKHMRAIIQAHQDAHVLPILVAFTSPTDFSRRNQVIHFNLISARLAQEYDIPFINYWSAAQGLYNNGVGADGVHLTVSGGRFVLRGQETRFGMTLHNLLVLHTLANLRTACAAS